MKNFWLEKRLDIIENARTLSSSEVEKIKVRVDYLEERLNLELIQSLQDDPVSKFPSRLLAMRKKRELASVSGMLHVLG